MTGTFPVALNLAGRACLVVGNGPEAARRVLALSAAGALVTLAASQPTPELRAIALDQNVMLMERDYRSSDMAGKWLAVLCERHEPTAALMGSDAVVHRVFFCAVDLPSHNSFSHVGVARSGPVFVAVGSEGKAPALARRLKHELQRLLDEPVFAKFVEHMVNLRKHTPPGERRDKLNALASQLRLQGRFVVEDGH